MESCVQNKLQELGYNVSTEPYGYIEAADAWYRNELIDDFHKRMSVTGVEYEIDRLNFAKRGCSDDANLCEVVRINVGGEAVTAEIKQLLNASNFNTMYRQQLELMSALGTVCAYVRLDNAKLVGNKISGGEVKLSYCDALHYAPLKVINNEVIEAAFFGEDYLGGKKQITLVTFTLVNKLYKANTYVFNESGTLIKEFWLQLGEVKPFAVMRVAEVNNIRNMFGFGIPKVYNAIPILKKLDLCNMVLNGDLEKGEKYVLTNEALVEIDKDTGKPKRRNAMWKRLIVILGKKPIDGSGYIQEYNPSIRIDEITKCFELCLNFFSMFFGFGSKKYSLENGQIQTATQFILTRQDGMQDLNKQRVECERYISDLIHAMMWYSNTFCGTAYKLPDEICVDFDDSVIIDRASELETIRADAVSFNDIPEFTIQYIMRRLNVDRKRAMKIYENNVEEDEPEQLD